MNTAHLAEKLSELAAEWEREAMHYIDTVDLRTDPVERRLVEGAWCDQLRRVKALRALLAETGNPTSDLGAQVLGQHTKRE